MGVFLQRSVYRRKAAANFSVAIEVTTPYKLFLKLPWVNKQLASSDFTLKRMSHEIDFNNFDKSGAPSGVN
jgi:hypothetical protein